MSAVCFCQPFDNTWLELEEEFLFWSLCKMANGIWDKMKVIIYGGDWFLAKMAKRGRLIMRELGEYMEISLWESYDWWASLIMNVICDVEVGFSFGTMYGPWCAAVFQLLQAMHEALANWCPYRCSSPIFTEKIRNLISHLTIRDSSLSSWISCSLHSFCGFLYPLRFNFGTILSIYWCCRF